MTADIDWDDIYVGYADANRPKDTLDGSNKWSLIPNVYEPIVQDEPCRARSAGPRLESGTMVDDSRELCNFRQHPNRVKMRTQRHVSEDKAKWTSSSQPINRIQEGGGFNNHANKTTVRSGLKGGCLSQRRLDTEWKPSKSQSRQSNWENWMEAGDRLFGHSSRN